MKRDILVVNACLKGLFIVSLCLAVPVQASPSWKTIETDTHRFTEVAPGVYLATGTGRISVFGNCFVVVNESDTVVVDSHVSPRAAEALLASIRAITNKPVRFLVNTHFHHDHVHGNQAFPEEVAIIGHESARDNLLNEDPGKKARLEEVSQRLETMLEELDAIVPTPPDVTFEKQMLLYRGNRLIQLLCFGHGHTGGDVLVYLPKEKVVFTGDFLLHGPAYMADCYVDEWIEALEEFKKLDFDLIVPGHGDPFSDRSFIDAQQRILQSLWDQLAELRKEGIAPEQAIHRVDLSEELAFYSSPIPSHIHNLDPRIAIRVYERLAELE
jgi:glyoxylase-like metal-dependent hydrolase (beta-lactamase superfamily II)